MIGVVISAHNESEYLSGCLRAVLNAARARDLRKEPVTVIVVLDACTDETARVARQFPVKLVSVNVRNVGIAGARGADLARSGASIAWSAAPRVVTSARRDYRVKHGFGANLARLHGQLLGATAGPTI